MGIKRYLNVIVTLVLFVLCLFLVYILSLDNTHGYRAVGDRHFENEEYREALDAYRTALLVEFGDRLGYSFTTGSSGEPEEGEEGEGASAKDDAPDLETLLTELRRQNLENSRVIDRIYDCWFKLGEEAHKRGDRGLLDAERYLRRVTNAERGEFYRDAVDLLATIQRDLNSQMTVEVGEIMICAYTVHMDLPEPPEDWDPEVGPWNRYRWVMREEVNERTITKRQLLQYPEVNRVNVIDDYASQENARAYMVIPGRIAHDSPVEMAVKSAERVEEIRTGEHDRIPAGEHRFFMMLEIELTNISNEPYTITLAEPAMLRLYRRRDANFDEPMTSVWEDRRNIPRRFFDDEFTIPPGETVTGWVIYWTYNSDDYYFKVIRMTTDEVSGTVYSEDLAAKRLPRFTR